MSAATPRRAGLRLPPFGRELLALRRRGLVPARVTVVALDLWQLGCEGAYPRIVIPSDLEPDGVDLAMVAGIDLFLAWKLQATRIERVNATVEALLRVAPSFLWCCPVDAPHRAFVAVSRREGVLWPRNEA